MGAGLSTLRDNFTDNDLSSSAWIAAVMGSASADETSAQARFGLPSSVAGTHIGRFTSKHRYTLIANSAYVQIATMVSTSVVATAWYQLYLTGTNTIQWIQWSGTLYARYILAGVVTVAYSITWNATTHKYLRIRESAGFVEWHSSTDGITWTLRAQVAISLLFPLTDLYVDYGATCGNVATPGNFIIDAFNMILPAPSSTWYHTRALWPNTNRHSRITLARQPGGSAQGYLVSADDMDVAGNPVGNIRYWSGPAGEGRLLTESFSQAAAQALAVDLPQDGSFDLPVQIDGRFFRLYHRTLVPAATYILSQLVPRRLVESDDMRAESVLTIHLGASVVTVDKLDALLTITGKTIQTDYNGPRVLLSGHPFGGVVTYDAADTYNPLTGAGTYQILLSLGDGALYAAQGAIQLNDAGINIYFDDDLTNPNAAVRFLNSVGGLVGSMSGYYANAGNQSSVSFGAEHAGTNKGSFLDLYATRHGTGSAGIRLAIANNTGGPNIWVDILENDSIKGDIIELNAPLVWIDGDTIIQNSVLNVEGVITVDPLTDLTNSVTNGIILRHRSSNTPTVAFGIATYRQMETSNHTIVNAAQENTTWAVATNGAQRAQIVHYVHDWVGARAYLMGGTSGAAAMIGFLGAGAIIRPIVPAAAPAGGTGTAAGGYDTAANRNLLIALVNSMRTAGVNLGLWA